MVVSRPYRSVEVYTAKRILAIALCDIAESACSSQVAWLDLAQLRKLLEGRLQMVSSHSVVGWPRADPWG
jgi:hypothetical protein